MNAHLTVITLGVDDLDAAVRFYRDGLGFATDGVVGEQFAHGAVAFFALQSGLKLALWPRASIAFDAQVPLGARCATEVTLGHNVGSRQEVDAVIALAAAAGAQVQVAPHETFWGGYAGYFRDLDGHLWEVVWNPAWTPTAGRASQPGATGATRDVETLVVTAGRPGGLGEPLNTPLVVASNYRLGEGAAYAREDGTPTWHALEAVVGALEAGESVAFASGMAAIAAIFDQLAPGATVVLPSDVYQGVVALAEAEARRGALTLRVLPLSDTDAWCAAAATADLIWIESPSNPLLIVADVRAICAAPRKPGALVVVDNTFATPLNQRPLDLGAHLSVQSATKFIGGHSDLLLGVVSTQDAALARSLRAVRGLRGATPGALEAFLATRGVRTLALRLARAQASAQTLAERLARHPGVARVHYPGLTSHPTHAIAKDQLGGFGAVLSFELRGGAAVADVVCRRVRIIQHATSLGSVESTVERRAAIEGQGHLPPGLLRLSVGVEAVEDLWRDLVAALDEAGAN